MKRFWIPLMLIIASCSTIDQRQQLEGSDFILQNMQEGLTAFQEEDFSLAKDKFQLVSKEINKIWSGSEDAKKAGSLWYTEKTKIFRGEAYERMMVDYYLGLLFFMENDFGNAQAAFKQGLLHDVQLDSKRVNFQLLLLLAGISLNYLGSKSSADEMLREYKTYSPLPFEDIPNVILIAETGYGPLKKLTDKKTTLNYVSRDDGMAVSFDVQASQDSSLDALKERSEAAFEELELEFDSEQDEKSVEVIKTALKTDIHQLAVIGGERLADKYNQKKSDIKDDTEGFSDFSLRVAGELSHSDDEGALAAALLFATIGVASGVFSMNVLVEADDRAWLNLPANIHVAFGKLSAGKYKIKIKLFKEGLFVRSYIRDIEVSATNKPVLMWFSPDPR